MGDDEFELEYTCAVTGEKVSRIVKGFERARSIARELAMASNRRAVVRRKRIWRMLLVDIETASVYEVDRDLDTDTAAAWWQGWDGESTRAVALPWPACLPLPQALEAA
jgi:glucose-6-phosphate isomerase